MCERAANYASRRNNYITPRVFGLVTRFDRGPKVAAHSRPLAEMIKHAVVRIIYYVITVALSLA